MSSPVPSLDELARDPARLERFPVEALVALRRRIQHLGVEVDAAITLRGAQQPSTPSPDEEDRYLSMQEVATRTGLSLSYLYELARSRLLPVTPMGRGGNGTKRRGYRVRLSELRAWEASLSPHALDTRLSTVLSSGYDRLGASTSPATARPDASPARSAARRPSHQPQPMGARTGARPERRGPTAPAAPGPAAS